MVILIKERKNYNVTSSGKNFFILYAALLLITFLLSLAILEYIPANEFIYGSIFIVVGSFILASICEKEPLKTILAEQFEDVIPLAEIERTRPKTSKEYFEGLKDWFKYKK